MPPSHAIRDFVLGRNQDLVRWGLLSGLVLGSASGASAAADPFFYVGGHTSTTEKIIEDDRERLLEPYTVDGSSANWEVGGGVAIRPAAVDGRARWEIRARYGLGGGDLDGNTLVQTDPDPNRNFTIRESFDYKSWSAGVSFVRSLHPQIGLFVGPTLQSVEFEAKRDWSGAIPQYCYDCGSGKDRTTVRYGSLEVGARYRPTTLPIHVEGTFIPKRFDLSRSRRTGEGITYRANFADLTRAVGLRLTYDF